ncbi:uncharacterized protein LOC133529624 isoform X1 [Cydia pomonella]|uniref:uncharacterized protein LOC133529624 isoform X1 n=1 Tax=Cydia pomonella TaxID=82600 RepID=UPI002ADE2874|nr:uncharacterized protein LOC133529624 isoform X1 [Cydia pomonella]
MTAILLIACMVVAQAGAGIVELNCSDNATCIEHMAREFVRSMRQQRAVRVFDALTIEPVAMKGLRQARSRQGFLSRFLESHAFSFDWNDWSFRLTKPEERSGVVDLEVYESRTAKDVSEQVPKKSNSKVEEEEDKTPKRTGLKRRQKKKVLQAVIPLMFGMKSAGAVIFSMALVTALTLKAYVASKLALMVTVGMAIKKLYETYGQGVGLQNHPYLYSQYPIDFPSASSQHTYSVPGMNAQFGPEMYNPALAPHSHELLQQNDASAQQSQQQPTLLVNSTRASERWDGKSKLLQFIEPIVDGFKNLIDPIANVFYDAMPATFRGLTSDVSTTKSIEDVKEKVKKPREILVPQPRNIAQRKMTYKKSMSQRPKKYNELKLDLDKMKHNKDFHDYVKTKKYKYNYPNTYYYPRVKYFVNPHSFYSKTNNTRLIPYKKDTLNTNIVIDVLSTFNESSEWKPIVVANLDTNIPNDINPISEITPLVPLKRKRTRVKRGVSDTYTNSFRNSSITVEGRQYNTARGFFDYISNVFSMDSVSQLFRTESKGPPHYYSMAYDALMLTLEVVDGIMGVSDELGKFYMSPKKKQKKKHKKKKVETLDDQNRKKRYTRNIFTKH